MLLCLIKCLIINIFLINNALMNNKCVMINKWLINNKICANLYNSKIGMIEMVKFTVKFASINCFLIVLIFRKTFSNIWFHNANPSLVKQLLSGSQIKNEDSDD